MLKGSIVALVTPMHKDGSVDYETLQNLLEFHVTNGTDAIAPVGTTGESATLSITEQVDVIAYTVKQINGRIPVIAGTGSNATAEAVELSHGAKEVGADASLSVVPYYIKPTQEGMIAHFQHIAESVDIDQILYNVPGRTIADMQVETVAELAKIRNITGIKDATGDVSRVAYYKANCPDDFALYSGDDSTTLEFIKAGGHGCISVTANVAPKKMHEMCQAAVQGDIDKAAELNAQIDGLHNELFCDPSPAAAKWALSQLGLCENNLRLPLLALNPALHDNVRNAMKQAGLV